MIGDGDRCSGYTQVGQVLGRLAMVNVKHQDAQFVRYTPANQ